MSQRDAVKFLGKALSDAGIMDQLQEVAHASDDPAVAIAGYSAEHGFEVTPDEIREVVDTLARIESGELSLEDLDAVAGGVAQYDAATLDLQADSRQFTLISNIMKTKHDTAKNAINNVR